MTAARKLETPRERPILFRAEMVRAILEGRKTQTRRVAKLPSAAKSVRWVQDEETFPSGTYTGWVVESGAPLLLPRACPYGQPGDRLWVRETWAPLEGSNKDAAPSGVVACHRADRSFFLEPRSWRPSIHMPRWASRITLPLVSVMVERLQDISNEDAWAEGCTAFADRKYWADDPGGPVVLADTPRDEFQALWTSINGPESWDANPWVWVLEWSKAEVRP